MNRLFARLSALALMLLAMLAPLRAAADPADITAASRSVVRVVLISDDGQHVSLFGHGSGLAVAGDLVITNAHVVSEMANNDTLHLLVIPAQGQRGYVAKVAAFSARNDLALLKISGGTLTPATLSPVVPVDGQQVFAVGYPGNVDLAQGLDAVDMITPTPPVKTEGTISTGRSSKSYDTILHTASLAAGNSGGPLLDACGRVVGVNSFGTLSEGSDSEFFFAVSMREIMRFLHDAGVVPRTNTLPCQSMADFDRAEAERLAGQKALDAESARIAAEKRSTAEAQAARQAELEVIAARENGMALAGVAVLLAILSGGAALWFGQQGKPRERKIATVAAVVLALGALAAWFTRPDIDTIESRSQEIANELAPTATPSSQASVAATGALRCVIDTARSRVTVSDMSDVPFDWHEDGCVNGRTQYGLGADGWSRVLVPGQEDTVTVASFDPATRTYKTERYLLDLDTITKAREARAKFTLPQCGGGEAAARKLGDDQAAIKALLPPQPNERLVYKCSAAPANMAP